MSCCALDTRGAPSFVFTRIEVMRTAVDRRTLAVQFVCRYEAAVVCQRRKRRAETDERVRRHVDGMRNAYKVVSDFHRWPTGDGAEVAGRSAIAITGNQHAGKLDPRRAVDMHTSGDVIRATLTVAGDVVDDRVVKKYVAPSIRRRSLR